jgi:hypothetical protein
VLFFWTNFRSEQPGDCGRRRHANDGYRYRKLKERWNLPEAHQEVAVVVDMWFGGDGDEDVEDALQFREEDEDGLVRSRAAPERV